MLTTRSQHLSDMRVRQGRSREGAEAQGGENAEEAEEVEEIRAAAQNSDPDILGRLDKVEHDISAILRAVKELRKKKEM